MRLRLLLYALFFLTLLPVHSADAATRVTSTKSGNFLRVSFAWDSAVKMKLSASGKQVTLHFSKPLHTNITAIAAQLQPHVKNIRGKSGGKTVSLSLNKPYRVRQFLSGNTNGIDIIIGKEQVQAATANAPTTLGKIPDKMKPTEKTVKKSVRKKLVVKKKAIIKTPAKRKIVVTKKQKATQKTATKALSRIKPKKPVSKISAIYSTKKTATNKPVSSKEKKVVTAKKQVKKAPVKKKLSEGKQAQKKVTINLKKPVTTANVEAEKIAVTPDVSHIPSAEETKPPTEKPKKPAKKSPPATTLNAVKTELLIGMLKNAPTPTLEFAWLSRTALSTFTRDSDFWVIFSQEIPVNIARLISILPPGLTDVEQFGLPGHTVLRFHMNKKIYPQASHVEGTYHWRIAMFSAPGAPTKPVEYSMKTDKSGAYVAFKSLDSTAPISFYDPIYQDRLLIAPLYDNHRAVIANKILQGSEILLTGQGIAVRSDDDSMQLQKTRTGLNLTSAGSLPATIGRLPFLPGQKTSSRLTVAAKNIVLAYHKFSKAAQNFADSRARIARELSHSNAKTRPKKLHELAGIYIAHGFGPETAKILHDIRKEYPLYYREEKLGIMHTAALFLADRLPEAAAAFKYANMDNHIAEVRLWGDVLTLFGAIKPLSNIAEKAPHAPTKPVESQAQSHGDSSVETTQPAAPIPIFNALAYHDDVLQFYPPRIRQKLSIIAADNYIQRQKYIEAVKVFDLLSADGILKPIQPFAEYLFGRIAAEKGKVDKALKVWNRLVERNEDAYITVRADFCRRQPGLPA